MGSGLSQAGGPLWGVSAVFCGAGGAIRGLCAQKHGQKIHAGKYGGTSLEVLPAFTIVQLRTAGCAGGGFCAEPHCPPPPAMLLHRYVVSRLIWAYMLSIAMTYFITLCLFPGLESEIHNCTLGEWLPILIMAIFNLSDFVGKVGGIAATAVGAHPLHPYCLCTSLGGGRDESTVGHPRSVGVQPAWGCSPT